MRVNKKLTLLAAVVFAASFGAVGCSGGKGAAGDPGTSALVSVSAEAAGDNCVNGGQKIDIGLDDDGNGVLDAAEVDSTTYVCNGSVGDPGGPGDPGDPGLTALVSITDEPAGDNCADGGQKIEAGLDDNGDGVLDPEEVDTTNYVCNGADLNPETAESCVVCHGEGKAEDVAVIHPDPAEALTITVTSITDDGTGILTVNFSVTDEAGDGVEGLTLASSRIYVGTIVPAGTATAWGTWDTAQLERWAYESSSSSTPTGTWTDLTNGDYSYTMVTGLGSAAALAAAPDYADTQIQRVSVRIDGRNAGYDRAIGIQDFETDGTLVAPERVIAPADGCQKCHSRDMQGAAHGGGYKDPRQCLMCHTPIGTDYGDEMIASEAWLASLVHKIHAAIPMAAFPDRIGGLGYGAVTYPQDVRNCETCHTGSDNMTDAWKTNPTAEGCGTCHEDIDFANGVGHAAQANNNNCSGCHNADYIIEKHAVAIPDVDVPEFDVTMTITPPANNEYYVADEAPMVMVTLKNHADGSDVDPAFYTTARGDAGVTNDLALRMASVYIYGPRALSVPVLATNTMHDPAYDPTTNPTQGHSMFTDGGDVQAMTDATGFKYQLLPIPADIQPGTYMVRVRFGDYSRVGSGDYHIESTAFATIQIGTADEEPKVSGDACMDCHGTGNFLPHNERHSAVFDTDECLSCHDYSHNHAIPIGNRVHAIHGANSDGDLYNIEGGHRDWEHVTYPQDPERCATCHDSGLETYKTMPGMGPCAGCHVEGDNRVVDHMRQNGGQY